MKRGLHDCNKCCIYCEYDGICPHSCFPLRSCDKCQEKEIKKVEEHDESK